MKKGNKTKSGGEINGGKINGGKAIRAAVYVLSFAIPAGVLLAAYAAMGMFPWGDKSILITDMSSQYVDFFCALKNGDLFFSWSKALGTAYTGVFTYYVSSPLSILTLLVPNESMPVGLMFLTALKLGLAGLAYAVYSMRKYPGAEITAVLCACCYGLTSYNIAYSFSVMWLDGVIWLPLILLALERVLKGKSAGPFIAALTVCFVSTWYISYMIGIFCCIYLAVRLVGLKPDRAALLRVIGRFFGGAACALGLTAWLWLPTFQSMFNGKFQASGWEPSGTVYGPLSDIFNQLRPGQLTTITTDGLPNIFCGTAVVVLAVVWFFLRTVSLREKLAAAGALAVLFLSLWFTQLDKVWHLFQFPNWFPFRYSFVVSFFLIDLANQALPGLRDTFKENPRPMLARGLAAALVLCTVAELHYNAKTLLTALDGTFRYKPYEEYRSSYAANAALTAAAREDAGDGFFRMGATEDRGFNSPLAFGYAGITHYSSLYNYNVNQLTRRLGFAQSWMWCAYYGSTPVTDALLGVRYVVSQGELPYEAVARSGGYTLYKNPNVLPLAFLSAGEDAPVLSAAATPFERQNDLLSALAGGTVTAFTPMSAEVSDAGTEVSFTFTGTGRAVYADLYGSGPRGLLVNGEQLLTLGSNEAASVHYLGTAAAGEVWTVTVQHSGSWRAPEPFLWELDSPDPWESRWPSIAGALRAIGQAEVLEVRKNGTVRLSVTADSPRRLLTTIPAEDGWRAYVDGERVETVAWLDTFLSLDVPAGVHRVELRYTAPGLMPGLALGVISAAGLALAYVLRGKSKEKRGNAP